MTEIQDPNERNRRVIEEFRANGGQFGGQQAGVPLLLLTTTGAKSGQERVSPMIYLPEGDHYYVFAVNNGAPTNPGWYYNLIAHPDVTVEIGTEKFEARASVLEDEERERVNRIYVQNMPVLVEMLAKITRKVPFVLLKRKK